MARMIYVEIKKMLSSKILWLLVAGALLPGIIAWLMLLEDHNIGWNDYLHVAMFIFNIQSILTFAVCVSYIWAREYEENMIDVALCYPYPKYYYFLSKLVLMSFVILCTALMFVFGSSIFGALFLMKMIPLATMFKLMKILGLAIVMHFMLLPFMFLVVMITKHILSGIILGVVCLVSSSMFVFTTFMQHIPFYIPMVLSDNMFGYDKAYLSSYSVPWYILSATFVLSFILCIVILRKKWELR